MHLSLIFCNITEFESLKGDSFRNLAFSYVLPVLFMYGDSPLFYGECQKGLDDGSVLRPEMV